MDCWLILRRILTNVWLKNLIPKVSLNICNEKSIKSISRQFAFLLPSCWLPTSCISSSFAGQPQMQTRLSPWQIRGLQKFFSDNNPVPKIARDFSMSSASLQPDSDGQQGLPKCLQLLLGSEWIPCLSKLRAFCGMGRELFWKSPPTAGKSDNFVQK